MTPAAPPPPVKGTPFFFDVLAGKDRRVRPVDDRTTVGGTPVASLVGSSTADFAQCSPLLLVKFGAAKRFTNDWEIAGDGGVAISLVHGDGKVRESEVFADIEANKYVGGGAFVGTGISFWDLTRGDTFTPAWMLHVGVPLGHGAHPVYLVGEGRMFLDHASDVRSNYQIAAGVRIHF